MCILFSNPRCHVIGKYCADAKLSRISVGLHVVKLRFPPGAGRFLLNLTWACVQVTLLMSDRTETWLFPRKGSLNISPFKVDANHTLFHHVLLIHLPGGCDHRGLLGAARGLVQSKLSRSLDCPCPWSHGKQPDRHRPRPSAAPPRGAERWGSK